MLIYLKHPRHGVKIATLDLEAEQDEQNGWVRFDPSQNDEEPKPVENVLVRKRKRDADLTVER